VSDTPKRWLEGGAGDGERGASSLLEQSQPVPEADDLSRERVWRQVTRARSEAAAPARRWVLAAAMGVLALVAGGLIVRALWPAPQGAQLELTAGSVLAAAPQGSWTGAEAGSTLPERSRLKTAPRAQAVLKLERAALLVAAASDVSLESLGAQTFIRLSGGEVVNEVEPRRPGEPYVVQTTKYRVTVKGTVFAVRERAPDDVSVSVSRGLVEVSGEGGTWLVSAGHSWESRHPDAPGTDDIPARDRQLLEAAQRPGPRATVRVDGAAEADVSEGGVVLGPSPLTWSAPLGRYHFVAGEKEADADAESGAVAHATLAERPQAALAPAAAPVAPAAVEAEPEAAPAAQALPEPRPKAVKAVHRTRGQKLSHAAEIDELIDNAEIQRSNVGKSSTASAAGTTPSRSNGGSASSGSSSATPSGTGSGTPPAVADPSRTNPTVATSAAPSTGQTPARSDTLAPAPSGTASGDPAPSRSNAVAASQSPAPATPGTAPSSAGSGAPSHRAESAPRFDDTPAIPRAEPRAAPVAVAKAEPPEDPYAHAVALRRGHLYDEAANAFETVANAHGAHAEIALVELAELEQKHLNHPERALAAYQRYQHDFPHGPLLQEVELSTIELQLQLHKLDAARDQMNHFLDRYPSNERAAEVRLLRADVLREQGDCKHALDDYAKATGPAQADDALYFTAWCQQHLGRRDDAATSFSEYLRRFPAGRHEAQARAALQPDGEK
jgi:outer membrane protein assembly factor BamD (BamD/ComL family)